MSPEDNQMIRDLQASFEGETAPDQQKQPKPSGIDLKSESARTTAQSVEAGGR
jgi:hypothetical protein